MVHRTSLGSATLASLGVLAFASAASAQYVVDNSKIPSGAGINSSSENVDFGDVDLDGDWDAVIADGGDDGNDQNRIWINLGGLQGGTKGFFADETATRFPVLLDDSRDIEFVDFDSDGDLDIYTSNTAQLSTQGNRWWTNDGGKQGGTLGFYTDETAARWIGLGGPGSSVAPSQVVGGTFIDFSCDCDFGDLDNDGDLDLVHSSYGGAFGGQVPTRLFLNDGDGHFEEFNPSGFQLSVATIAPGNPGLWCEGVQQTNTTNFTGQFCDIASSALDIDLGDIDGDFDLDILHGARQEVPRMFVNRLDGSSLAPVNPGGMLFRDVSALVFPAGYSTGDGHYEQEMADLDFDGDLDIYGLNWTVGGFSFNDITLRNNGDGTFGNMTTLAGSGADDNEGDFVDYDNDGDLDLYVANFSGQDKLYRNNNTTPGSFSFTLVSLPSFASTSLDADACDTDGDGDYDILVAEDNFQANTFLLNTTQIPDTHAPYLPNVENIGNQVAAPAGNPIRVHVYDNAPYYITWYNETTLDFRVNGIKLPSLTAMSSQGQIFRGVLPGNLVGSISYGFTSSDEYGNTGSSGNTVITGSYGPTFATAYGSGTSGLSGGEPVLSALSAPFSNTTAYLAVSSGASVGAPTILGIGTQSLPGIPIPGLLTLNIAGVQLVVATGNLDANGDSVFALPIPTVPSGVSVFAQGFVADPTAGGQIFASSKGLQITTQ